MDIFFQSWGAVNHPTMYATCKSDEETAGIKGRRLDAVSTAGQLQAGALQGSGS